MHTTLTKVYHYIVIEPINAVLVQPHSLFPPTTNTWLGEIGTAVLPNRASGIRISIEPDPGVGDGEESMDRWGGSAIFVPSHSC